MIACSLNEVETLGRRAARGAGMAWGLAEEAGKAARWLAARGMPGSELLAGLLAENDGRAYASMAPVIGNGVWSAPAGALCPVACGAALSDRVAELAARYEIALDRVSYPLLLAPFVARMARWADMEYDLHWPRAQARVSPAGDFVTRSHGGAILLADVTEVAVTVAEGPSPGVLADRSATDIEVASTAWMALTALARRTYLPATDASRARGAGPSGGDGD